MTHKLIKTDDYLFVVNPKEVPNKELYNVHYLLRWVSEVNILAHLPLNGSPVLEGVDLLPSLEDDVEKLAEAFGNNIGDEDAENIAVSFGYKSGYNKAREKYKYTEEDVRMAISAGLSIGYSPSFNIDDKQAEINNIIQSLHQYPTEFDCEMILQVGSHWEDAIEIPKTTIINGRRTWVGKYN